MGDEEDSRNVLHDNQPGGINKSRLSVYSYHSGKGSLNQMGQQNSVTQNTFDKSKD